MSGRLHRFTLCFLLLAGLTLAARGAGLDPGTGLGSCIWAAETRDRQECRFVRAIEIPAGHKVNSARLRITADNAYQLFIDGQPVGQGSDWRVLIQYEVSLFLTPGEHVLAVRATNDFDVAGLELGLRIELDNGAVIEVPSDASWRIAPDDFEPWQTAPARVLQQWPAATLKAPLSLGSRPQIYLAPVSTPLKPAFWERKGFQFSVLAVAIAGIVTGLFLASRLVMKMQMEKVVRRERARIAADLHDNLGGGLTQLALLGETSLRSLPAKSKEAAAMEQLCDQSRELARGMNETVWLINSQRDTIADFASYVAGYAETFFRNSDIRCLFDIEPDLPALPCDIGTRRNLFLALKEALNNTLRHSGATTVKLSIHRRRNELTVTLNDDGRGLDPASNSGGNGLKNMSLRAAEAGGRFSISSHPGQGCTLSFHIPL